jgi:hypothetical protein
VFGCFIESYADSPRSVLGLKSIGYVQIAISRPISKYRLPSPTVRNTPGQRRPYLILGLTALALVIAFSIPYVYK